MNKKLLKKSFVGFMILTIFLWPLGPILSSPIAGDDDVLLRKMQGEQLDKTEQLKGFDSKKKTRTFSADAGLKKTAEIKQPQNQNYVEGEVLIKFKERKINLDNWSGRLKAENFAFWKGLEKKEDIRKSNISVLKIKGEKTVEEKIAELKNDSRVEYVEPNYKRYPAEINTNDEYRGLLWGLDNTGQTVGGTYPVHTGTIDKDIDAPDAWEISEGNNVIVAIIDDGVAYNHPDLVDNMWDGIGCKGSDKDGNPITVNCKHGYDYEDGDEFPLPTSGSHGTHIAGTIGAMKNNNKGIIGVAPNVKIMALKFGLDVASEIKAIDFAIQNEAKIINASFTGSFSQSEYDAINSFKDAGGIFIAAAGNGTYYGDKNIGDIHGVQVDVYPCDYNLDNIICVAATDSNDNLAGFSDYGVDSVDVGAPGVNIYSTVADTEVFSEDFESDTYSVGANGNWIVGSDGYSKVAYSDPFVPYDSDAYTWLMQDSFLDLSDSKISGATINFTIWCDTPIGPNFPDISNPNDYILTSYHSNGSWHYSTKYDEDKIWLEGGTDRLDSGYMGSYETYTENISDYLTDDFYFSFDWITDSSIDNNLGCTIDNIKITKYTDGSDENYDYANGTSMAAPHVAGLAALIWGYDSSLTYDEVKNVILTTGDDLPAASKAKINGGEGKRINAHKALLSLTDTTPPVRDNGLPTEDLSSGTTQTVISLETDENATCKYSETAETDYSSMTDNFSTTGEISHSTTVAGLADGQTYNYYVRCEDETGNPNTDDFAISFGVAETPNTPPEMQSVTLSPNPAFTNDDIVATAVASDSDIGDTVTFFYQWKNNGENVGGDSDTLSSDNFIKGNEILVIVTPNDGTDDGEPMTSGALIISNSIPTQPTVSIDPNPAYADDDLVCNASDSTDVDDDVINYSYRWYQNSELIVDYNLNTISASLTTADDLWKCEVVADDGEAQSIAGESSVTILEVPDEIPPTLTETTPVPTPTNDNTPDYTFHSDEAGTIAYSGGCASDTVDAVVGGNIVTFNELADGTYGGCEITVTDTSDNASTPLIVNTFTVDTVAPVVAITSPADGLITNQNPITLNWTVDGEEFSEEVILEIEGDNILTKNATDDAGNTGNDSIVVTLDITPPAVVLSNTPDDPTNATTTDIIVGDEAVTHYRYSLDGGVYSEAGIPVNANIQLADLSDGEHTLSVIGRDEAGNWQDEADPTEHIWTVDTIAPVVEITSPADGLITNQSTITIEYTADGVSHNNTEDLSEGINTVVRNVTDDVGNVGSDSITVILDTTSPTRDNGLPTGALSAGTVETTLSLTTNEDATCRYATSTGVEYDMMTGIFDYDNDNASTTHSTLITDLTDGSSYSYYVKCQDELNNTNTDDYEISFSVEPTPEPEPEPEPTPAPSGGGGGYTPPSNPSSVNSPLKISSNQKGTLTQNLNNENKVKLEVPKGSVKSNTTFTASKGSLTSDNMPKNKIGAFLFNGLVFTIEAVDINNNAVREFSEDLTITLTVPDLPDDTSSLELYYFDDENNKWIIIIDIEFGDDTITFKINHLTQFAVFEIRTADIAEESKQKSEEEVIVLGVETDHRSIQLQQIATDANDVWTGNINSVTANAGVKRDLTKEIEGVNKYTKPLIKGIACLTAENKNAITNFIVYGTNSTQILGAGERAGVVNSYKSAFGKLPTTQSEWEDVIKIANGRWPSETNPVAEEKAKQEFRKVYKRNPDMDNPNDNAAVTVIAYGLRPSDRNLDSEKAGIKTFKHIYGYDPASATDWDIVRAIAYSGATR